MDIRKKITGKIDRNEVDILVSMIKKHPWLKDIIDEYEELRTFCDTKEQKELINELLDHFTFITMPELTVYVKLLISYIQKKHCLATNTIFYSVSDTSDCDSSQALLQFMKNKFPPADGWTKKNFCNDLRKINEHNPCYTNVFLVDDFCGTGKTATRKIVYAQKILEKMNMNCKVELLFIASMRSAENKFLKEKIPYYSTKTLKKGISDFYHKKDIEIKKDIMLSLENKLSHNKNSNYFPYGYKKSESLFSIESYNIPNNVFPIFWWNKTKNGYRNTMFKRVG